MNDFLKLDQAVDRVKRLTGNPEFAAYNLIDLAKQERLRICFEYRGDISVTWEHSPDGISKEVGTMPFNGIVKLLQRPTTNNVINEFGVLVSILRSDGQIQRTGQPYRLPVPTAHGGYINPGYEVVGFIDETEVPRSEWMIHTDDLNQIIAASVQPPLDAPAGTTAPATEMPALEVSKPGTTTAREPGTSPLAASDGPAQSAKKLPAWLTQNIDYIARVKRDHRCSSAKDLFYKLESLATNDNKVVQKGTRGDGKKLYFMSAGKAIQLSTFAKYMPEIRAHVLR